MLRLDRIDRMRTLDGKDEGEGTVAPRSRFRQWKIACMRPAAPALVARKLTRRVTHARLPRGEVFRELPSDSAEKNRVPGGPWVPSNVGYYKGLARPLAFLWILEILDRGSGNSNEADGPEEPRVLSHLRD